MQQQGQIRTEFWVKTENTHFCSSLNSCFLHSAERCDCSIHLYKSSTGHIGVFLSHGVPPKSFCFKILPMEPHEKQKSEHIKFINFNWTTKVTQNVTIMLCVKGRLFQKHCTADSKCASRACHMPSAKLLREIIIKYQCLG